MAKKKTPHLRKRMINPYMLKNNNTYQIFESLSTTQKIGQCFFPAAFINDSDKEIKRLEDIIKNYGIGGLTFFHSRASAATNFEGKKQIIRNEQSRQRLEELIIHYQSCSSTPLLISIDAEWGLAMRVENTTQYPYALTLGAIPEQHDELIFRTGSYIGQDLLASGIHLNLAPVADINLTADNPVIGYRSFGEDKKRVSQKALAFYNGLKSAGVLGCFKHFPGHGDTLIDSHIGLPIIEKTKDVLNDQELYPFKTAIAHNIDSIMVGHLAVPTLSKGKHISATLSTEIIQGLLREKMGFKGAVISDALNMHSVSKLYDKAGQLEWEAFNAGNDILCFAEHIEEGIQLIEKNATNLQVETSFNRILNLKEKAFDTPKNNAIPTVTQTKDLELHIAKSSITAYKTSNNPTTITESIVIDNTVECVFIKEIQKKQQLNVAIYHKNSIRHHHSDRILIALFVPSMKPKNNFGIPLETIQELNELSGIKRISLYIFGNPYITNILDIDKFDSITLCYQHLVTFQQIAAKHFLKMHQAIGISPIQTYKK